ncbi:MAG: B12-binding domain-containing radical SAM protein [Desulfobacteraceae bacterium]|nr:MAG: B12-binding domain-containing radical SAM protein [Desulfobacteraceae bacterium]
MKKILFINPSYKNDILENVKVLSLPPLNLAILASHTPDKYEIEIIDETIDIIDFDKNVDLVAITCMTPLAPKAYEISTRFREKGTPVVLGGIHASMMSQEAMNFVNTVVIGEGEEVWQTLLKNYEAGNIQKKYISPRPSMENLSIPRRDLCSKSYFIQTVQTSRGCPFDCNFCSVTRFNGGRYRFRPVNDVIAEISMLKGNRFFFIDDNIVGSGQECFNHAFQLFERLKDLGKEWGAQTCINVVENDNLLQAAAKNGAKVFFIGFESVESEALLAMNKQVNLRPTTKNFKDAIKKIHDNGIAIVGGFIFGNDTDTKDIFNKTLDFIHDTELDAAQFSIQTPFPSTKLYEQLYNEGRLLLKDYPKDWKRYNGFEVVFQPKNMTVEELQEGHISTYKAAASLKTSFKRAIKTFFKTKSLFSTTCSFYWNYDCYKMVTRNV